MFNETYSVRTKRSLQISFVLHTTGKHRPEWSLEQVLEDMEERNNFSKRLIAIWEEAVLVTYRISMITAVIDEKSNMEETMHETQKQENLKCSFLLHRVIIKCFKIFQLLPYKIIFCLN